MPKNGGTIYVFCTVSTYKRCLEYKYQILCVLLTAPWIGISDAYHTICIAVTAAVLSADYEDLQHQRSMI